MDANCRAKTLVVADRAFGVILGSLQTMLSFAGACFVLVLAMPVQMRNLYS